MDPLYLREAFILKKYMEDSIIIGRGVSDANSIINTKYSLFKY